MNQLNEVVITTSGGAGTDELRSLREWLTEETPTSVRLPAEPPTGTLGGMDIALAVAAGGGTVSLLRAVVTWLRYRTADVECTLKLPDGAAVTVTAKRVQGTEPGALGALVAELAAALDQGAGSGAASPDVDS